MEVENRAKVRKALGDVTNCQLNPKSPVALQKLPPQAAQQKEMAFLKQIQQKNKIIELAGIEIQNLRNVLLKTQQQNQSLAQSNTQMLAELNRDKQRLKEVQQELAISKGLFKATKLELEELKKVKTSTSELPKIDEETKVLACETGDEENIVPTKACKRGRPSRSQSLGVQVASQPHAEKEVTGSKRLCARGKSDILSVLHEDVFDMEEDKFPKLKLSNDLSTNEVVEGGGDGSQFPEESQRTSVGRPMRRSVAKVQSYKEKPINIKMRRPG